MRQGEKSIDYIVRLPVRTRGVNWPSVEKISSQLKLICLLQGTLFNTALSWACLLFGLRSQEDKTTIAKRDSIIITSLLNVDTKIHTPFLFTLGDLHIKQRKRGDLFRKQKERKEDCHCQSQVHIKTRLLGYKNKGTFGIFFIQSNVYGFIIAGCSTFSVLLLIIDLQHRTKEDGFTCQQSTTSSSVNHNGN